MRYYTDKWQLQVTSLPPCPDPTHTHTHSHTQTVLTRCSDLRGRAGADEAGAPDRTQHGARGSGAGNDGVGSAGGHPRRRRALAGCLRLLAQHPGQPCSRP
eukprot:1657936-Rhodomonas_salina.1